MRFSARFSRLTLVAVVFGLVVGAGWTARAETVFRAAGDPRDEMLFRSSAPLEKITGRAGKVLAEVKVSDPNNIVDKPVSATFVVDLSTIDTGIALRNKHMREQYLETDKYPTAVFMLDKIKAAYTTKKVGGQEVKTPTKTLAPNVPTHLTVTGTFAMHGVKREIRVEDLTVIYIPEGPQTKMVRPGDLLRVMGTFGVKLSDYNIERPQLVLLKLSDDVEIEFNMTLGTGVPAPKEMASAGSTCDANPCGGSPCGGNADAANPCGGNPCGGNADEANPCGGNPCGGNADEANPCGGNPCGGNPDDM